MPPTTRSNLVAAEIYEIDEETRERVSNGTTVHCMFNPFEYTVSKSNSYTETAQNRSNTSQLEFQKAGCQTLKLDLMFDTYESGNDVSRETEKLWDLMEVSFEGQGDETRKVPPPAVMFHWGVFRFAAVITTMSQRFILFKQDGTPVRAKVTVTFKQHRDFEDYDRQNPTSGGGDIERIYRLVAGDRLDIIAYQVYGDSARWRDIAEYNRITDPLNLRAGQRLIIPRV